MQLEGEPAPPDPEWLKGLRADWAGFIVPFMHDVFTEPEAADVIAEMIAIGLEATPEVVVTQELELDWQRPARLLGRVTCPTVVVHGEADVHVPVAHAESIVDGCRTPGSKWSRPVGTVPTSAPRSSSTRLLEFSSARRKSRRRRL